MQHSKYRKTEVRYMIGIYLHSLHRSHAINPGELVCCVLWRCDFVALFQAYIFKHSSFKQLLKQFEECTPFADKYIAMKNTDLK